MTNTWENETQSETGKAPTLIIFESISHLTLIIFLISYFSFEVFVSSRIYFLINLYQ